MGLRCTYQFGVLTSALSITAPFKRQEFDDAVHHIIAFQASRTQYELSNHLGNVLVTISDNRVPVDDGTYEALLACPSCRPGYPCIPCHYVYIKTNPATDEVVDRYTAVVVTVNDKRAYFPIDCF
jgi:hypothetical protein